MGTWRGSPLPPTACGSHCPPLVVSPWGVSGVHGGRSWAALGGSQHPEQRGGVPTAGSGPRSATHCYLGGPGGLCVHGRRTGTMWGVMCVCDPAHMGGLHGGFHMCSGVAAVGAAPWVSCRAGGTQWCHPSRPQAVTQPGLTRSSRCALCPPQVTLGAGLVALSPRRGHRGLVTCGLTSEMSFGEAQPALSLPPFPGCSGGLTPMGVPEGAGMGPQWPWWHHTHATVPLCPSFPWQSREGAGHVPTR